LKLKLSIKHGASKCSKILGPIKPKSLAASVKFVRLRTISLEYKLK
jgi:hypothetical protein